MNYQLNLFDFIISIVSLLVGFIGGSMWQKNRTSIKQENVKGNATATVTNNNKYSNRSNLK